MNLPSSGPEPGTVIGARYRIEKPLEGSGTVVPAVNLETGVSVLLLEVSEAHGARLALGKGLEHAHLARIGDVVENQGKTYLVHEQIAGARLESSACPALSQVEAGRMALRLAEALTFLHREGVVHGFVHPHSIILRPESRPGPVLSFAPWAAADAEFRGPEQPGPEPHVANDVWGMAGILHLLLLGAPPPAQGYATADELSAAGLSDRALGSVLFAALARERALRTETLQVVRRALTRWYVQSTSEGPPSGPLSSAPPPLPSGLLSFQEPTEEQSPRSLLAPRGNARLPLLVAFGIGLGMGAGFLFRAATAPKPRIEERASSATAAPESAPAPALSAPITLSEVPVLGQPVGLESHTKTGSCVASHFPPGSFEKAPDASFLCAEADPRAGAEQLHKSLSASLKAGGAARVKELLSRMGAYDMAAFALLRGSCCENPTPLALNLVEPACPSLLEALAAIADQSQSPEQLLAPVKAYGEALRCVLTRGHGLALRARSGGEESALMELVRRLD